MARVVVKIVVATLLVSALGYVAFIFIFPRLIRDPEVTNVADLEPFQPYPELPEFWVSDPTLLRATAHKIQGQIQTPDGGGVGHAAYFVQLKDGRRAFGYTDDTGFTRPIYTDSEENYDLFWVEDALERMLNLLSKDGGWNTASAIGQVVSGAARDR